MSGRAWEVGLVVSIACVACVGSKTPATDGGASTTSEASIADDLGAHEVGSASDSTLVLDTPSAFEAAADSSTSTGDGGESCPDPAYPPRTDGCPCFPPGGLCSTSQLGKTCDYYQTCPGGAIGGDSGRRARCEWVTPMEGDTVPRWVPSSFGCPSDAGPG